MSNDFSTYADYINQSMIDVGVYPGMIQEPYDVNLFDTVDVTLATLDGLRNTIYSAAGPALTQVGGLRLSLSFSSLIAYPFCFIDIMRSKDSEGSIQAVVTGVTTASVPIIIGSIFIEATTPIGWAVFIGAVSSITAFWVGQLLDAGWEIAQVGRVQKGTFAPI